MKPKGVAKAQDRVSRAIAEGETRARYFRERARRCTACHQPMVSAGPTHFLCDPGSVVGRVCTCPQNCTTTLYGNGARACDDSCVVCRVLRGTPYSKTSG